LILDTSPSAFLVSHDCYYRPCTVRFIYNEVTCVTLF